RLKTVERSRMVPVVFLSCYDEAAYKVNAFKAGGVDYITKPFHRAELLARVDTHLALSRMQKQLEMKNAQLEHEINERRLAEAELKRHELHLEEVVTERTKDLRNANEILQKEISERQRMEQDLSEKEDRYRRIFENAQEGIFRSTPEGRFIVLNPAAAKIFGYDSPVHAIRDITDISRQLFVEPEERAKVKTIIKEYGALDGYEVQLYKKDGSIIWVTMTMHAFRGEDGRLLYYDGIIQDVTERKQSLERLRKALGATVQAIVATVEAKDPYTAGHQRRVADLARSLATEMGLDAETIDGVRMAAAVHDLGKISIPAEILSKPGKLTDIEFMMVKIHAQSGHDLLKEIDFPRPIARMVLEHHERMNGSGYPNGLKGEALLLESRILAVADVVESMVSHRPYRPALGLGLALDEIAANKGILYDGRVVETCLKLFTQKGYYFPS
ncbi:MAG: PAS domain S-box protein, partial [Syntrophales bacterium]|nr:PAS domain S-box protein [Syntrophales bacterium]